MLSFEQVCQELKKAELVSFRKIEYNITKGIIADRSLKEKVNKKFQDYWKERPRKPDGFSSKPNFAGCCEIGRLTGCEIMWLFSRIFKNDDLCKYGNCLYLFANKLPIAAILFLGSDHYFYFPKLVPKLPLEEKKDFRHMFIKLFDDDTVKQRRLKEISANAVYYSEEKINGLRCQAKSEYSKFLKTPLAEFSQIQFRNAFLGLMMECAFGGCPRNRVKTEHINPTLLPFAACLKLAFDQDDYGRVRQLFGEVFKKPEPPRFLQVKAKAMLETATRFISK